MWFGLYLSAYDVHYQNPDSIRKRTASPTEFNSRNCAQTYGVVDELWFDSMGANEMLVNWRDIIAIIQKHQPNAVIFNNLVPDMPRSCVRWPGNKRGDARAPNWSVQPAPDKDLKVGEKACWFPAEADAVAQG